MLLSIEPDGSVPIYQQIRDRIVEAIATGEAAVGSGLPSTRQLAVDLGINFHTVNKAYDLLRQQGLIQLNRKTGAVITAPAPDPPFPAEWTARARTLLAEAVARGVPADEVLRSCQAVLDSFGTKQPGDLP